MAITVEKFDRSIYNNEKCSFAIDSFKGVYNVSEGTYTDANDDELWSSPLWRNWRTTEQLRQELWVDIQTFLPIYQASGMNPVVKHRRPSGKFQNLILAANDYLNLGKLKLIYISDRDHAEMIAKCIQYLADRLRPF